MYEDSGVQIQTFFDVLATILLLGNIQFADGDFHTMSASISNMPVVEQAARRLQETKLGVAQRWRLPTSSSGMTGRYEPNLVMLSEEVSVLESHCDRKIYQFVSCPFLFSKQTLISSTEPAVFS